LATTALLGRALLVILHKWGHRHDDSCLNVRDEFVRQGARAHNARQVSHTICSLYVHYTSVHDHTMGLFGQRVSAVMIAFAS
jgi:hypothetical protein